MDLGAAQPGKGAKQGEVIVDIPTEDNDINKLYENELRLLATKEVKVKQRRSKEQKQEDYYKVSGCSVVLSWGLGAGSNPPAYVHLLQSFRTNVSCICSTRGWNFVTDHEEHLIS
jgi:hypothetical protein